MSYTTLSKADCHYELRESLLKQIELNDSKPSYCISLAWDWLYIGETESWISKSAEYLHSRSTHNQSLQIKPLAVFDTSLLRVYRNLTAQDCHSEEDMLILQGFQPTLVKVVNLDVDLVHRLEEKYEFEEHNAHSISKSI